MEKVENILNSEVKEGKTPSVQYLFFNADSILYEFASGYSNLSSCSKSNSQTTFNGYSITKTFTALAILQLVEKSLISLDKPVRNYLPNIALPEEVTVKHLLTHTAGLANPLPLDWIHLSSEHEKFNRDEYFSPIFLKNRKLKSTPGSRFKYSNLGYLILGQIIEAVTGTTYEEYITANINSKLQLESDVLGFEIPLGGSHSTGYHNKRSFSMILLGLLLDKSKFMDEPTSKWKPFKEIYVNGTPYGGMIGNSHGFVKYGQELLKENGTLLSDELKQMMFSENKTKDGKNTGMCLSWFKGELKNYEYYTHAGGGGGYYCELRLYPDLKLGSFIVFNRSGFRDERYLDRIDILLLKPDNASTKTPEKINIHLNPNQNRF